MSLYELGKKAGALGFIAFIFMQILSIIMHYLNAGSYTLVNLIAIAANLIVVGGFGLMFLEKRDITDFVICIVLGLELLSTLFGFSYPTFIYIIIYIAMYGFMILRSYQDQNLPMALLLLFVLAYSLFGFKIIPTYILKQGGYIVCNAICALFCLTRQ